MSWWLSFLTTYRKRLEKDTISEQFLFAGYIVIIDSEFGGMAMGCNIKRVLTGLIKVNSGLPESHFLSLYGFEIIEIGLGFVGRNISACSSCFKDEDGS